jgi:hypothetical protein
MIENPSWSIASSISRGQTASGSTSPTASAKQTLVISLQTSKYGNSRTMSRGITFQSSKLAFSERKTGYKNQKVINQLYKVMTWLGRLVAGLSPRTRGFASGSVHVGFVMDKLALGQGFFRVVRFSLVNMIPYSCFTQGINHRPVGGRSSET